MQEPEGWRPVPSAAHAQRFPCLALPILLPAAGWRWHFFLVGICLPAGVQRNYFPLKRFPGMQALDVSGDYLD